MRVIIADDHSLLVEGLCSLLAAYDIEVVGTASNGQEAVESAGLLNPDLVLMDINMPICNGLEATRRIKARQPEMKIVMLTTSAEDKDLFEAIKSGACGYLLKSMKGEAFIEALHGLEQGTPPFSPGLAARLLQEFSRLAETPEKPAPASEEASPHLTERQTEVLQLIASGLTYKEVGVKLSLSERTVRYHMGEIMDLLHLENRSQAIAYAGKTGVK